MSTGAFNASLVDDAGNIQDNTQVEVRDESTGNLAAPFEDYDLTIALGNPFNWADGSHLLFYCDGGLYKVTVTKNGFEKVWRHVLISGAITGGETGILFAEDYGVVGDGATINTTNLQAAEDARSALGAILGFRGGIYRTGPITIDRQLGGGWMGFGYTRFVPHANGQTMFTLSNAIHADTLAREFFFRNVTFNGNGFTSITAVAETLPNSTLIENCGVYDLEWACLFDRGRNIRVNNITQGGTGTWGFIDTTGSNYIFDVVISNLSAESSGGHNWAGASLLFFTRVVSAYISNINSGSLDGTGVGMTIQGPSEGVFVTNMIVAYPTTGIQLLADGGGNSPFYVYLTNVAVDQPTVDGFNLNGTAIRLTNVNATNGAIRTNSGSGIVIQSTASDVTLDGVRVQNNYHDGIEVETGATKIKMSSLELIANAVSTVGFDLDLQSSLTADVHLYGKNNLGTVFSAQQAIVDGRSPINILGFQGSSSGTTQLQASASATGVLTLPAPAVSDVLVGRDTTDTLTNKTFVAPVLGTPASGNLVNCTGYEVADLANLGAGIATWLATPSSANLAAAVTGETGTGALVFATSPTLVTPILGTPQSGTLSNCTGLPISTGVSGLGAGIATFLATPSSANLAAAVTGATGTGALVFGTNPTLTGATLAGTVAGGGNQINNVVIGASSPLAGTFNALTVIAASPSFSMVDSGTGTGSLRFYQNTSTEAYRIGNEAGAYVARDVVNSRYFLRFNSTPGVLELGVAGNATSVLGSLIVNNAVTFNMGSSGAFLVSHDVGNAITMNKSTSTGGSWNYFIFQYLTNAVGSFGMDSANDLFFGVYPAGFAAVLKIMAAGTQVRVVPDRATQAAASAVAALTIGSALVGLFWGTGAPGGVVSAAKGSLYIQTDAASTTTRLYINHDGGTGWANFTTST